MYRIYCTGTPPYFEEYFSDSVVAEEKFEQLKVQVDNGEYDEICLDDENEPDNPQMIDCYPTVSDEEGEGEEDYNFYLCRFCHKRYDHTDVDCESCGKEMCVYLFQEDNLSQAVKKCKEQFCSSTKELLKLKVEKEEEAGAKFDKKQSQMLAKAGGVQWPVSGSTAIDDEGIEVMWDERWGWQSIAEQEVVKEMVVEEAVGANGTPKKEYSVRVQNVLRELAKLFNESPEEYKSVFGLMGAKIKSLSFPTVPIPKCSCGVLLLMKKLRDGGKCTKCLKAKAEDKEEDKEAGARE